MTVPVPIETIAERLDPWRHLDARCALAVPGARAWLHDGALICAWEEVIHAIDPELFGPTAVLLGRIREQLPPRLELRAGPAMGGILTATHRTELVGPQQRLALGQPALPDPLHLVRLTPSDADRIRALADDDAPIADRWLASGPWLGALDEGILVAACGVRAAGGGAVHLAAPVLHRTHRRRDTGARLLAALGRRLGGDLAVDVRLDRRDRVEHATAAGFRPVVQWERWVAHPLT